MERKTVITVFANPRFYDENEKRFAERTFKKQRDAEPSKQPMSSLVLTYKLLTEFRNFDCGKICRPMSHDDSDREQPNDPRE